MNKPANWNYNASLKPFASSNRKKMTKAEACLWKHLLSRKQLMGYQFNRQRPVGNYIADFLCKELKLIIEVDGLSHQFEAAPGKDKQREIALQAMGFTVFRFSDDDVLHDLVNVKRALANYAEKYP